jgi:hypothetical protein
MYLLLHGEETIPVNFAPPNFNCFGVLLRSTVLHGCINVVAFCSLKVREGFYLPFHLTVACSHQVAPIVPHYY